MKICECNFVLYVHNNSFKRKFRKGFKTFASAHRNLKNYKNFGFHGELHDNFKGLVLETF